MGQEYYSGTVVGNAESLQYSGQDVLVPAAACLAVKGAIFLNNEER